MLEMLIAFSRVLSFDAEGEPREWFWTMLDNVDLAQFNDRVYNDLYRRGIGQALYVINYRLYLPSGEGGFFPLRHPTEDQREVELWYQFCAYLPEHQ